MTTWFFLLTIVLTPVTDAKGGTDVIHVGGFQTQAQCEAVRAKTMVTTEKLTSKLPCKEEMK
jgi:hypothetical protein